ncbi:translation initiation factor [Bacteroidota bacterium]
MNKPKKAIGLESLANLVFSTNEDNTDANLEETAQEETNGDFEEIDASSMDLRVSLNKKNRNGKAVTLVTGFGDLDMEDVKNLAKMLKSKCGVGGAAKDSEIIIQGDHVVKVIEILKQEGFKVKRSGG